MSDDPRDDSARDTAGARPPGDWREVADALNSLGESIARATNAAVDDEENRRRLRELSEGLAALSRRVGESVADASRAPVAAAAARDTAPARPEVRDIEQAVVQAAEAVREAGETAAEQARPHVLHAIQLANEKFRHAAEQWEKPPEPEVVPEPQPAGPAAAAATPVAQATPPGPSAPPAEPAELSIHAWLFPEESAPAGGPVSESSPETAVAPTAAPPEATVSLVPAAMPGTLALTAASLMPAPEGQPAAQSAPAVEPESGAAAHVSRERLDAVRVAHERFLVERRAAEGAASEALLKAHAAASEPHQPPLPAPPSDEDAPLW